MTDRGENIISLKKIYYNGKRYGWVAMLCLLAAFLFAILLTVKESEKGLKTIVTSLVQAQQEGVEISESIHVTAASVGEEFELYLETDVMHKLLNDQLKGMGYEVLEEDDEINLSVTGNMLELTVRGNETEKTQYLNQLVFQEMLNYYESDGMFSGLRLLDTSTKQTGEPSFMKNMISVKNLFITLLGGMVGLLVLFVIICLDKKIYIKEDILLGEEINCLFTVEKRGRKRAEQELKGVLRHYKQKGQVILVSAGQMRKASLFESEKLILFDKLVEKLEKEEIKNTRFVILIRVGKDKKAFINEMFVYLRALDIEPMGCVLVEE